MLIKNRLIMAMIVGVLFFVVSFISYAEEPIKNLRVRLECYPTGEVKTELFATRANVHPDGSIVAYGLILTGFTIDGKVEMKIVAKDCVFDQGKGVASSTNAVLLTRGDIKVSGRGFNWKSEDKKLEILKRAKVVFPVGIIKGKGVLDSVKKK